MSMLKSVLVLVIVLSVATIGVLGEEVADNVDDKAPHVEQPLPLISTQDGVPERFWNTLRPQVYFGAKTREQFPLLNGFMWFSSHISKDIFKIRHTCDQGDELSRYGWIEHDGVRYGKQEIVDSVNNVRIFTSFVRRNEGAGGAGDWLMRFEAEAIDKSHPTHDTLSVLFYMGNENENGSLALDAATKRTPKGVPLASAIHLHGQSPSVGDFSVRIAHNAGAEEPSPVVDAKHKKLRSLPDLHHSYLWGLKRDAGAHWSIQKDIERQYRVALQRMQSELLDIHKADFEKRRKEAERRGDKKRMVDRGPDVNSWPMLVPTISKDVASDSNLFVSQRTLKLPFTIDVAYVSHAALGCGAAANVGDFAGGEKECNNARVKQELEKLSRGGDAILKKASNAFKKRFSETFGDANALENGGGGGTSYAAAMASALGIGGGGDSGGDLRTRVAQAAFSNMLGGHGYWHGSSLLFDPDVKDEGEGATKKPQYKYAEALPLYSGVPSRSFFPRGFLWDEGFHQLLISEWDTSISYDVLAHWLNLMRPDGWIPREQILGAEAESRVPTEFIAQNPKHANPPTLLFAVEKVLRRLERADERAANASDSAATSGEQQVDAAATASAASRDAAERGRLAIFLSEAWPRLVTNYNWYAETQHGALPFTFRWRGRTENHTLSSGLDDYPRAQMPSDDELHVDGLSWLVFYSRIMAKVARFLSKDAKDVTFYEQREKKYTENVLKLHWNEEDSVFYDTTATGEFQKHVGYVSLFPLMLGVIEADSKYLGGLLDVLTDPEQLYSDNGIRSLSKKDKFFSRGEDYWRGHIWMNANYMIVSALRNHYWDAKDERVQSLYKSLRDGILANIAKEYKRTGFLWEQYHEQTGEGRRCHPFTGWTATAFVSVLGEHF